MDIYRPIISGIPVRPAIGAFGYASISLIYSNGKSILIDTGSYGERKILIDFIKRTKVDIVVLTHLHHDHCANADLFHEIPIYVSSEEIDFLKEYGNGDPDYYLPFWDMLKRINVVAITEEVNITDSVKIISLKGHTIGHIGVEFSFEEGRGLVAGDSIKSLSDYMCQEKLENAYLPEDYQKTKQFIKTTYELVIPGHDKPIIKKNITRSSIELRLM